MTKGKGKDADIYTRIFENIRNVSIPENSIEEYLTNLKQRSLANELALTSFEFSEGKRELDDILAAYNKLEIVPDKYDVEFVSTSLSEIYQDYYKPQGLRWRLKTMNQSLGSLRKGDFGFIFARPETGKTTFLISEVSFMLNQVWEKQLGPILWFNNEEQGKKVMLRFIQGYYGLPLTNLLSNLDGYDNQFRKGPGELFKLFDSASISKWDVERIVNTLQPSLILFDQIDKIKGFKADRDDLRLGDLYAWSREIAKSVCPVLGVCQADGSGEGQKWLTMENVALAKTAKQAEADFILGIGKTHDQLTEQVRYFHLSKNKLHGDEDTLEDYRHGRWEVRIEPTIARYSDFLQG